MTVCGELIPINNLLWHRFGHTPSLSLEAPTLASGLCWRSSPSCKLWSIQISFWSKSIHFPKVKTTLKVVYKYFGWLLWVIWMIIFLSASKVIVIKFDKIINIVDITDTNVLACHLQPGPRVWWWVRQPVALVGPLHQVSKMGNWRLAGWKSKGASWRTGSYVGLCCVLTTSTSTKMRKRLNPRYIQL